MREYIEIGAVPANEDCQQVGTPEYNSAEARKESLRFLALIREKLGPEPEGARLALKSFPHDFGSYTEVVCYYDDSLPESVEYAFNCESNAPVNW